MPAFLECKSRPIQEYRLDLFAADVMLDCYLFHESLQPYDFSNFHRLWSFNPPRDANH